MDSEFGTNLNIIFFSMFKRWLKLQTVTAIILPTLDAQSVEHKETEFF